MFNHCISMTTRQVVFSEGRETNGSLGIFLIELMAFYIKNALVDVRPHQEPLELVMEIVQKDYTLQSLV